MMRPKSSRPPSEEATSLSAAHLPRRAVLVGGMALAGAAALAGPAAASEIQHETHVGTGPLDRQVLTSRRSSLTIWNPSGAVRGDVVLVPSLGRMESDFDPLTAALLASGYRALTYNPLIVDSVVPTEFTLHDVVHDLVGLLDHAGVGSFHAIGHAFGARITRLTSVLHSDRGQTLT